MKRLSLVLSALLLSSCASLHYGNFTTLPQNRDSYLAEDAASQLLRISPPAERTLCISQTMSDAFGVSLLQTLRKKGYGLIEHCPRKQANFFYVVDEIEPHALYRVSLYLGGKTLNRVYAKSNATLTPVSAWSYQEALQ